MSRSVRIVLSIVLSLLFLAFAVQGVDWRLVGAALAEARYVWVLPVFPLTLWSLYIRGQRWRVLLRPVGSPSLSTLVAATNIGFMANMVLPLRAGEVIRPLLVARKEKQPLSGILATILLERIFDMFTILFLFGIAAASLPISEAVRQWGLRLLSVAVLIGGGVAVVRWQEKLALKILDFVLKPFPAKLSEPVGHFFRGFVQALEVLASPLDFIQILAWSLLLWLVISAVYWCGLLAFQLPVPLVLGAIVVTADVAIAVSMPSAPGYVGAIQVGCVLSLAIFQVSESDAIAYSIVIHVSQFFSVVACGLYSLTREGMSLRQIEQVSEGVDGQST